MVEGDPVIVLASRSPRRAELLREAGIAFEVVPPAYEEPEPTGWAGSPADFAERLSRGKAATVAAILPHRLVLAADTIVTVDGTILGKADTPEQARRILERLAGTVHQVITGVTLAHAAADYYHTAHAVSECHMRPMSTAELAAYLAGGQWRGKAGAYGIQDCGDPFVTLLRGSYSNVVGLPLELVRNMLAAYLGKSPHPR